VQFGKTGIVCREHTGHNYMWAAAWGIFIIMVSKL
jgi:hypothetical protein